jgi:hypothetical protein
LAGEPAVFEKMRELTRGGYVPDADADPASTGILMRHETAPDLILNPDGSIDLPTGTRKKRRFRAVEPAREKRIYWRRTFLVVVITIGVWFLSLAVTAAFIGEMVD